jgi:hypothetical protein
MKTATIAKIAPSKPSLVRSPIDSWILSASSSTTVNLALYPNLLSRDERWLLTAWEIETVLPLTVFVRAILRLGIPLTRESVLEEVKPSRIVAISPSVIGFG